MIQSVDLLIHLLELVHMYAAVFAAAALLTHTLHADSTVITLYAEQSTTTNKIIIVTELLSFKQTW